MILIRPDTASDFKAQGRNSITELTLLHNCCAKVIDHGLEYNRSTTVGSKALVAIISFK